MERAEHDLNERFSTAAVSSFVSIGSDSLLPQTWRTAVDGRLIPAYVCICLSKALRRETFRYQLVHNCDACGGVHPISFSSLIHRFFKRRFGHLINLNGIAIPVTYIRKRRMAGIYHSGFAPLHGFRFRLKYSSHQHTPLARPPSRETFRCIGC